MLILHHARQSLCTRKVHRHVLSSSFAFACIRSILTLLLICPITYKRNIWASTDTCIFCITISEGHAQLHYFACELCYCLSYDVNPSPMQFVLLQGTSARILETRKTAPGLRLPDKWAVLIGGGSNHRIGLFDMVMIKDNHVTSAGGIVPAIQHAQVRYPVLAWLISLSNAPAFLCV